jgi:hypothetical protein
MLYFHFIVKKQSQNKVVFLNNQMFVGLKKRILLLKYVFSY